MLKKGLANLAFFMAAIVVAMAMLWFASPFLPRINAPPRIRSTPVLLTQVQSLSQLVTVKYVMEKVVIIEDMSHWYELQLGENKLLMVAHGIVKAGVDLSELKPGDIRVSGSKITVKLPPARITDTYLDDKNTQVIERSTGLLRRFDKDLEQNARVQAVEEINLSARNGGILKDANERAKEQLTIFFHQMGCDDVEFK